uniref:RING-type domain-containing protein n=1 Tax=viral metagenome TaxID=1070528 RepID=A0A6C0EB49_9ZZZZ
MNIDGQTFLIYDKSHENDHAYNSAKTSHLTIDYAFKNFNPLQGEEAIREFNNLKSVSVIDPNLDLSIYDVFYFKISDNPLVQITLISIDNKKFEKIVKKNHENSREVDSDDENDKNKNTIDKLIPNYKFIIDACHYHILYEKGGQRQRQDNAAVAQKNINEITQKVLIPNGETSDKIIKDPEFAKLPMKNYQKRSVKWMYDIEKQNEVVYFSMNDEISIGNIIFDALSRKFIISHDRKKLQFHGGALIDEVGLGKTYQMLALTLSNQARNINYFKYPNKLYSRATIIFAPSQLCKQWEMEIKKTIKDSYNTSVIMMLDKRHFDKYTYQDLLDADFILVSYTFLGNKCYTNPWINKISTKSTYLKSDMFDYVMANNVFNDILKEKLKSANILFEKKAIINIIYWRRIIFDEFHEVFTVSKYKHIKNLIKTFDGEQKWAVTGTPFNKGNQCLLEMLNFVTKYENEYKDRVFYSPSIKDYMLTNFFRRNTKKSVEDETTLPPLREHIIWLKPTKNECAMYNAYIANENMDRMSVQVRQICCHPSLITEIKSAIANCKTPEEIKKTLLAHHKRNMLKADNLVKILNYRIENTKRNLIVATYRQERKFIRKIKNNADKAKYKVTIIYPPPIQMPSLNDKEIKELDKIFATDIENEKKRKKLEAQENNLNYGNNENDENDENNENIENLEDNVNMVEEDSSDSDDDEKEPITISENTQKQILKLVGNEMDNNELVSIQNLRTLIQEYKIKLADAERDYNGKKVTYDFYNNTVSSIVKVQKKKKGDDFDDDDDNCVICLNPITGDDVGMTKCGHIYCYNCIVNEIKRTKKCTLCKTPLTFGMGKSDVIKVAIEMPTKTEKMTKEIKDKMALIEKEGTKLANLMYFIKSIKEKCIVFSQWDDMLLKVGHILSFYGIKNVFCRGNVYQRSKAISDFVTKSDVQVIMLSSASSAAGINLTVAKYVIMFEPVYEERIEDRINTEWQAIGRAHRTGQDSEVTVVRLIIKGTVEEEIYNLNKKQDESNKDIIKEKMMKNNDAVEEVEDDELIISDEKVHELAENAIKNKDLMPKTKIKKVKVAKVNMNDLESEEDLEI